MRHLGALSRHSPADLWLLGEAACALVAIKAGLALLPLRRIRRALMMVARPQPAPPDKTALRRVIWAVKKTSAVVPGTYTCLPKALAAQVLLERRGFLTALEIGFARTTRGDIEGHAWLRCGGDVVMGDDLDLTQFTPLASLPSRHEISGRAATVPVGASRDGA